MGNCANCRPVMASSPRNCNYPVRQTFEPGSAFKICVIAAALDLGLVDDDAMFRTEDGRLRVKGGVITDLHPHAVMSLAEAVKYSSNIVAALMARDIGQVFGIAVDDAHHYQGEFSANRANPGRAWVVVKAPELSSEALMEGLEAGRWRLQVKGGLEIKGDRHTVELPLQVRREGDEIVATGEMELQLKRLGIKPPSVAGVVNVDNDFRVSFEVRARAQKTGAPDGEGRGSRQR